MILVSPQEFFKTSVNEAASKHSLHLTEGTEFYLVNLLTQCINSDYLFSTNEKGKAEEEALVLMLADAIEEQPIYRAKLCQKVGDISLYVSGFFSDSFKNRLVDIDYYISMGRLAYGTAKNLGSQKSLDEIYEEIIEKFNKIVTIFNTISSRYGLQGKPDLLKQKALSPQEVQTILESYDILSPQKDKKSFLKK